MRASFGSSHSTGLHIGDRPTEESEFEQVGGGFGGLPVAVVKAPLVGHPPLPDKSKKRISDIRYPTGSEYLRAVVRCSNVVGPSLVEPSYVEIFATIGLRLVSMFGAQTFSPLTSSMFLKWFAFFRWPLRMVSASPCTLSSSASFSTLTYAQPSFPPTSGASWLASSLFLGIKGWAFPA